MTLLAILLTWLALIVAILWALSRWKQPDIEQAGEAELDTVERSVDSYVGDSVPPSPAAETVVAYIDKRGRLVRRGRR